ncbi:elongation factor P hydroxylase [Catenovulum sediminis]|uniref:elongation factor P hydroxylase n=1 Tax=Catenovulum sediminis TaxID=1740262 RepID=UPI001FE3E3A2|nr:elongation factor P hydroxylase [Catenovulum sediminis]
MHKIEDLIRIFERIFFKTYNTKLVVGHDEPVYLPADENTQYHQIVFAHGFYASALHEIAHWCLAGPKRREQLDYGYWYNPDGRNKQQQQKFEFVEIKPQAIEWILSVCAGFDFKVSCDNLNGSYTPDRHAFRARIYSQVEQYLAGKLPTRAKLLGIALADFYQVKHPFSIKKFTVEER